MKERFEAKWLGRLGPGIGDKKDANIMNRIVRWIDRGIELEADPRHAEIIVGMLGLKQSNAVTTPGVKEESAGGEEKLEGRDASKYRAMTARGNYLAQDRSDIGYEVKELSCGMASPTKRGLGEA